MRRSHSCGADCRQESPLSPLEARRILGLDDSSSDGRLRFLDRVEIQRAYLAAARRHHPDARNVSGSRPCAFTFRRCHEAREALLAQHCGVRASVHYRGAKNAGFGRKGGRSGGNGGGWGFDGIGRGFPHRTLRILTLRQNLALRGVVLTLVTVGTLYDYWTKRNHARRRSLGQVGG
uniref:J domain-containing protein n=1 Tax=Odontella aurita TaxID=265563 RepID=A0A7S4HHW5_9STRA